MDFTEQSLNKNVWTKPLALDLVITSFTTHLMLSVASLVGKTQKWLKWLVSEVVHVKPADLASHAGSKRPCMISAGLKVVIFRPTEAVLTMVSSKFSTLKFWKQEVIYY